MIELIVMAEVALLLWFFLKFEFYFLLSLGLFLWYATYFFDGNETTGYRTWNPIRKLHFGVKYVWGDKSQFVPPAGDKYLFVVMGNRTNLGLVLGFGLHGRNFHNVCYLLPWSLFCIPLVRDVLLWTGAVSNRTDLLSLLEKGRSVCYAPNGMETDIEQGQFPNVDVFEFAFEHNVKVVPVHVLDEDKTFWIVNGPDWVQQWCMQRVGWPWPFYVLPRWKAERMTLKVGTPFKPNIHKDAKAFHNFFIAQVRRYT